MLLSAGPTPREWHALQEWLTTTRAQVAIPFAGYLADEIPPVAVRLRRDFKTLLRLIETHALLHQCSRQKDPEGRVIATEADYLVVRSLIADLVAAGVGTSVPDTIRVTVEAVKKCAGEDGASVLQVSRELKIDRSAAHRRILSARGLGYLFNLEEKRGRPARYAIHDPLPDEVELLPVSLKGCAGCADGSFRCSEAKVIDL